MYLQPVFNYYKAVLYFSAYFSKSETLQALLLACGEIRPSIILHARGTMHSWEVLIQVQDNFLFKKQ